MATYFRESLAGFEELGKFLKGIRLAFIGAVILTVFLGIVVPTWAMGMLNGQMFWSFLTDVWDLLWLGWWLPVFVLVTTLVILICKVTQPKAKDAP